MKKCKIKNDVTRGSLLSMSDEEYKKFIKESLEFGNCTLVKENFNKDCVLVSYINENNKYYDAWFYKNQIELL